MFPTLNYNFFASGDFCHLLVTFTNSLEPDLENSVSSDLDPNCSDSAIPNSLAVGLTL